LLQHLKSAKMADMSGHSKWATIKRQKGVNDAKRGAVFTKLGNQIAIAARGGTDPATNSSLAMVIDKAKASNMPMANIERAIQRAADKSAAAVEEVTYEGYGPGGVAIIVECATDNKNRTYPEVRLAFTKNGGSMAEQGSVAFQFSRKGMIHVKGTGEELLLQVLDAGAEDAIESGDETVVYTAPADLAKVRQALVDAGVQVAEFELTYVPNNTLEITDKETARKIINLMNALEDLDDVSATHTNFDIADNIEL
jgi:YebC/PmpR family DNA-binding regulatory protein